MLLYDFKDFVTAKSADKSGEECWRLTGLKQPLSLCLDSNLKQN